MASDSSNIEERNKQLTWRVTSVQGDLCWMLVCTALCWQITPAIGFLYAGMHRRKAALTMVLQSLFCACACGIQFWIYGYSLYQARTTNPILGDLSLAVFHNVLAQPSMANPDIPDMLCMILSPCQTPRRMSPANSCPRCRLRLHIRFLHCHDLGRSHA
jgi:hypothetical protein